jgi:hypothetical protein
MKYLLLLLAALSLLSATPLHAEGEQGQRWAILAGVDDYADRSIRQLQFAVADAEGMYRVLKDAESPFAPGPNLTLLKNPTRKALTDALRTALTKAGPNDSVLVFLSAHAFRDAGKEGYLATADARLDALATTALAFADLRDLLDNCAARDKLLILDCCHAGAKNLTVASRLDRESLASFARVGRLLTLAGCEADQLSWEWEEKRHGLYTYYLIEALHEGDLDEDGWISTDELHLFCKAKVQSSAVSLFRQDQTPVRILNKPGVVPEWKLLPARRGFPEYFEDFRQCPVGRLPQGWEGDGPVVQMVGQVKAIRLTEKAASARYTLPAPVVRGDFALQLHCFLADKSSVNNTVSVSLKVKDGEQMTIAINSKGEVRVNGKVTSRPRTRRSPTHIIVKRVDDILHVRLDGVDSDVVPGFPTGPIQSVQVTLSKRFNYDPVLYSVRINPVKEKPR